MEKESVVYKIEFPIGDWSDDGHEKCEFFIYESNKPVEEVREAHFMIRGLFGFDVSDFAADYQDNTIPEEYEAELDHYGFSFDGELTPEIMADIWAFMLMTVDSGLVLQRIIEDIPSIAFYGFDDKGRHIGSAGYGLFEAW